MRARSTAAAFLAVAALGLGACGDDDESAIDNAVTPVETAPATTATTASSGGDTLQKIAISKDLATKPTIPRPSGDPPSDLYIRDVVKGTGKKARTGDNVTVDYVGTSFSTGEEFDASWDRGETFAFRLPGQVIAGWNKGVLGMREGGRRLLVIPPDLAYGSEGPPGIAPNETLLFVIDLKKVE